MGVLVEILGTFAKRILRLNIKNDTFTPDLRTLIKHHV